MYRAIAKGSQTIMDQIWGVTLHQFRRGAEAVEKADTTLVTETDRRAERLLRDFVAAHFPDHGVIGEEYYEELKEADVQWIIDPIDGTQNFFHGIPTYGTILGVHVKGEPVVSIIDHPALDIRLFAVKGEGAYWNGKRIHIKDAPGDGIGVNEILGLSTRSMFERNGDGAVFDSLTKLHGSHRIYFDIYATTLAVGGHMGAMVEYGVTEWDIAATELLITEAGGHYHKIKSVPRDGLPPRVSAVYGKPSIVTYLKKYLHE
jgi:histidinol-phosphatase